MPFLARFPSEVPAGSICSQIACNVDFAPTFLDFAGLTIPSYMQGESLRPLLNQTDIQNWQQVAYHRYWMHRDSDHNAYSHYGIRTQKYKLIYWYNEGFDLPGTNHGGEDKEWELFDCEQDPLELFNIFNDPNYHEIIVKLTQILEEKMQEIGDEPAH